MIIVFGDFEMAGQADGIWIKPVGKYRSLLDESAVFITWPMAHTLIHHLQHAIGDYEKALGVHVLSLEELVERKEQIEKQQEEPADPEPKPKRSKRERKDAGR